MWSLTLSMANILTKKLTAKQTFLSLFILFLTIAGYFIVSATISEINSRQVNTSADSNIVPITNIDPALQPLVDKLAIDSKGLTIQYVDSLPSGETGKFDGHHTISILRSGSKTQSMETILAHEYLHFVWSKYPQQKKDELSKALNTLYMSDKPMQERMQPYIDNEHLVVGSGEFSNELHSVYCTESSDSYLSQSIISECSTWINRSALTFLR